MTSSVPFASASDDASIAFDDDRVRHRYAQLEQVRLHYVEAGPEAGPLVVLLHGFPEFWYSWRHQIPALAARGFRVVAPDMRGCNRSDKPSGVANYRVEALADDVRQLIAELGADEAHVVGHDWGGFVAWWFAMRHPDPLRHLTVMNCPHPGHRLAMSTDPAQLRRSWYMLFFQLPRLPERRMRADDFGRLRRLFRSVPQRRDAFDERDIERYVDAMRGRTVEASINYYRAFLRRSPFEIKRLLRPVDTPTQVIWGSRDRHLGAQYAEPPAKWVWDLRMDLVDDASHWVQVDRPRRVNELLLEFLPDPAAAK